MSLFFRNISWLLILPVILLLPNGTWADSVDDLTREGEKLLMDRQFEKASLVLKKAVNQDPDSERALGMLAITEQAIKKPVDAVNTASRLILLKPDASSYWIRVYANYGLGNLDSVLQDCTEIKKQTPDDPRLGFFIANSLLLSTVGMQNPDTKKEIVDEAINAINQSIQIESDQPSYYLLRAEIYFYRENYDKALEDYQNALNVADDEMFPICQRYIGYYYLYLASWALEKKQPAEKCLSLIEKGLEQDPEYSELYLLRGRIKHYSLNNTAGALADYSTAIKIDDDQYQAYGHRAYLFNDLGLYEKAVEDAEKVIELDKSGDWLQLMHWTCGCGKIILGRHEEALPHLNYCVENASPVAPQIYFMRSTCLRNLNRSEQAQKDYESGMQILKQEFPPEFSAEDLAEMKVRAAAIRKNLASFSLLSGHLKLRDLVEDICPAKQTPLP